MLAQVEKVAALPLGYGFGGMVAARLELGERRHGHGFLSRTVPELLVEAAEEAEDLPAWALLGFQRAIRQGCDRSMLDAVRRQVVSAGIGAAHAHLSLRNAATVWKRAGL